VWFEGERSLFIECAWRVESSTEVLCASGIDVAVDDVTALVELQGSTVERVELASPSLDLVLWLTNGRS
jgi:hypothetical protein